jgi:hypothetical protein
MPRSLEAAVTSGEGSVRLWTDPGSWWTWSETPGAGAALSAGPALVDGESDPESAAGAAAATLGASPAATVATVATVASVASVTGGAASASSIADADPKPLPPGQWAFNAEVADRFDREAHCHIPDYKEVATAARTIALRRLAST